MQVSIVLSTIPFMNSYLLTLVLKPEMDEKERKGLLDSLVKKIVGDDGKVQKEDLWGVRDLAYKIKKQDKGFYAHYQLDADPKLIKGLDKILKIEEDILRYLLVRI